MFNKKIFLLIFISILFVFALIVFKSIFNKRGDKKNEPEKKIEKVVRVTKLKILDTPAKEASGLEWNDDKWIVVDDSGKIYEGDKKYDFDGDLEGVTFCNNRYYIAAEKSGKIYILDSNFYKTGLIDFKIGKNNSGVEGIACSPQSNLYVVGQGDNKVYEINLKGKILDKFELPYSNLSGADYADGILYVISDDKNIVMLIEDKKVVDKIKIGKKGSWEAVKVLNGIVYVTSDNGNKGK